MKKIKFYFVATILVTSITFYNCSNDDKVDSSIQNSDVKTSNSSLVASRTGTIIIPSNEAPDYDAELIEALGFTSFKLDTTRDCILDTIQNIVILPYDSQQSTIPNVTNGFFDVNIKIAKKNVDVGDTDCDSCVNCTGFRCKGKIKLFGITLAEWSAKMAAGTSSNERNQDGYVEVDEINKTINMYFYNDIEWNHLED